MRSLSVARTEAWMRMKNVLAACLQRKCRCRLGEVVTARRRAHPRLPARAITVNRWKSSNFDHARRSQTRHPSPMLGTGGLVNVTAKIDQNVAVILGPPGTGKTHLAIGIGDARLSSRSPRCVQTTADAMG